MNNTRLEDLIRSFKNGRVGIIGDFCLDAYWILENEKKEISVETGRKTQAVLSQNYSLGGAGNISANLAAMGVGTMQIFAVLGDDIFGREILNQLRNLKANVDGVVIQEPKWDSPVYAKPHIDGREQERIDFGRYNKIAAETEDQLLSHLQSAIGTLDILIINQQLLNSIYSDRVINDLIRLARQYPSCVFLIDARDICNRFENMILKMNSAEASRLCSYPNPSTIRNVPDTRLERRRRVLTRRAFHNAEDDALRIAPEAKSNNNKIHSFGMQANNKENTLNSNNIINNLDLVAGIGCQGYELDHAVPLEEIEQFAKKIYSQTRKPVYITRGNRGLVVYDGSECSVIPGIQTLKKTDPVGAGDTIMAALAASLAIGATYEEAGIIANYAGAVVVQKLRQTGTATGQEILELASNPIPETKSNNYKIHGSGAQEKNTEHAEDIRKADYLNNTHIEIIDDNFEKKRIMHAVFDHDGTISTLRQGWEDIMRPVMIKAILGEHYHHATENEFLQVTEYIQDYIDKSTGIQTILQMQALTEIVSEFGYVKKDEILSAQGYKEIYNQALMKIVGERFNRLKTKELDVSDFTIKGSVEFLKKLHSQGICLYLASGTDQEDVIKEAKMLGYADLFNGGIFGAVGDVNKYSKKMVLKKIMREHNLKGPQLAVFGDGPVELREARKNDGIAIGIASDEIRRYGLNIEKRERLIKAGANLIAPDFVQHDKLFSYLLGK
ncbi:HAD family hydrolase [bacterium]|nr:HAD family hydrolase [bacterium]